MQTITQEEIAKFLEGRDPMERIVYLDYTYQNDFINVFYRDEQDRKCVHRDSFYPFLWATKEGCQKLCNGDRTKVKELLRKYNIGCKPLRVTDETGVPVEEMEKGYTFMFKAKVPMSYSTFLQFFKECELPVYSKDETSGSSSKKYFLTVTPQEQYLIYTGKRFFKGYDDYDQLLRMIFDLETEGLDPTKHRIESYGIRFNRPVTYKGVTKNYEVTLELSGDTEEEKNARELKMIETALRIIYTFKPDVITAHNGENFDWNFIIERCKQLGSSIEEVSSKFFEGRSIAKNQRESVLKLGGEIEHFHQTIVPNITVTDSLHAVRRAQATNSNFLRADLKYATKFLKMVKKNRVYVPGGEISKVSNDYREIYAFNEENGDWYMYDPSYVEPVHENKTVVSGDTFFEVNEEGEIINLENSKDIVVIPKEKKLVIRTKNVLEKGYELKSGHYIVQRYLLDDLWECDKVESALNSADFMLCKIIPVPFSKCVTMGTAGQWKAIMMAWSYENGLAIPKPENTGAFTGGLSRLLRTGYVKKVIKLDYNSLYPSIILTWAISDNTDLMNAMLHMLLYVLTTRETHKGLKKKAEKLVDSFEKIINEGGVLDAEKTNEYNKASNDFKVEDNRQAVFKKVGNSFFGSYGSNNGSVFPWKSLKCAERTTCTGRMALRLMIKHFHDLGYEPIVGDTDGFNFALPDDSKYRYTKEHPYIGKGLSRETKEGVEYTSYKADVAEFNDTYMNDRHYAPNAVNKMGLGIDEVVDATINFSRKNYADYFPDKPYPDDVKMVGNTIKSKKMPEYISKFLERGIRQLLRGQGQAFLESYYDYIDKIYNYRIPLQDIASKGKVKKSIKEYIEDCNTITKAGRPKSRQAWMELAIQNNMKVDLGDTLYYINIGKTKSQADVKKVTKFFENQDGKEVDITALIEKEWKSEKTNYANKVDMISALHPNIRKNEEIILNAMLLPREVVESDDEVLCDDNTEYNVPKYIDQFNKRITPLLVCFSKEIRGSILITNPSDRPYFTEEQAKLVSGEPNKPGDQDTYEQLMTMEDKEIKFWSTYPEFEIPYLKECGMDWDKIYGDYLERKKREKELGIDFIRQKYDEILNEMSESEIEDFTEGILPAALDKLIELDPETGNFISKQYPDTVIGSIHDIFEKVETNYD